MQIVLLKASDLYYLPRVKNLEREYKKCEFRLAELNLEFSNYLDSESCCPYKLDIISDKICIVKDLMRGIKIQIKRLECEFCN
jgi:hypothetical protein